MVPNERRAALKTAGLRLMALIKKTCAVSTALVAIGAASSGRKGPATSIGTNAAAMHVRPSVMAWRGRQCAFAYAVMCTCVRILSNAPIVKRMPVALSLPVKRRTSRGRLR
jgi:hypothetical protein